MQCIHRDKSKCPEGSTHVDLDEVYKERYGWDDEEEEEEEEGLFQPPPREGYYYEPPRGGGRYQEPPRRGGPYDEPPRRGGQYYAPPGYLEDGVDSDYMESYGMQGGAYMDPYDRMRMEEEYEEEDDYEDDYEDDDEDMSSDSSPYTSFHNAQTAASSSTSHSPNDGNVNSNLSDLWEDYHCENVFSKPRSIPTDATWTLLRGVYQGTVGIDSSTIDHYNTNGMQISSTIVQQTPDEKGRGLFASEPIPKGTLIWQPKQTACFKDGTLYRNYLKNIPTDLACDVLQWAYVMDKSVGFFNDPTASTTSNTQTKDHAICVDLDEGILMNSGEYEHSEISDFSMMSDRSDVINIGCHFEAANDQEGGCAQNLFALYDIRAGEELLVDYENFADVDGWEVFGL